MTPSARIKASIEIYQTIHNAFVPMDNVIGDYMRGRKYIGSNDRRYVANFCYTAMRSHAKIMWWLDFAGIEFNARSYVLAALALLEQQSVEYIVGICNGDKYSPELLSDEEKAGLEKICGQALIHPDMPERVVCEVPEEHYEEIKSIYGDDFAAEMEAYLGEAALDLRVNINKLTREDALNSLKKENVAAKAHEFSPWGIRLKQKVFLSTTRTFKKRLIDIQDEGSQLIALACNAKPSMQVLDYCAGAGGKTLALANAMQCKGRVVAMDIDSRRLAKARPRFTRAGVSDIIEVRGLEEIKNRKWLRRQKATFDVTLLDVPCSGTGTWRRNPDLRWHHYGPKFEDLLVTQAEILDKISDTVKLGGRMVYATCSMLKQENEQQIEAFLARNTQYRLVPIKDAWPEEAVCPSEGDYMRLSPMRHGTDGFFAAVMERTQVNEGERRDDEDDEFFE
jgi:16S rRNA (cytosine967-C5)-methyltransferase